MLRSQKFASVVTTFRKPSQNGLYFFLYFVSSLSFPSSLNFIFYRLINFCSITQMMIHIARPNFSRSRALQGLLFEASGGKDIFRQ